VRSDWYRDFFQGVALDLWRSAAPPEQTRVEADFLQRALGLKPGDRVLDVPCGLGRHSLELASRGFRVTGVDLSRAAIDEARATTATRRIEVDWRNADMRDLPREAVFDGAFCFGNSFGYLDPAGNRAFIRAVAAAIRPGGRFALDTGMAAESILPRLRDREWTQIDDILFLEENRYVPSESRIDTTYTFVRSGVPETRAGVQYVYTLREIRGLLADAGLVPGDPLAAVDGAPFVVGSPCLILVAEKAGAPLRDVDSPSRRGV
jgi:cyclopropane fatty-acyl-phospholipid synthase-like methyltransferase